MKDRVPLYPGRVTLTPVSGQANTYDLTRADQPTQEGTPLNKASLLKDATAALFGLGTDAVPDDALHLLSRFPSGLGNEYIWSKSQYQEIKTSSSLSFSGKNTSSILCSNQITLDSSGNISLFNPETYTLTQIEGNRSILKGKYVFYHPDSTYGDDRIKYVDETAQINTVSGGGISINVPSGGYIVSSQLEVVSYVNSPSPDAYPPAVSDGYTYVPLGQIGDKIRIATGSYTGTGTYGASHPNSLTFGFEPKMVFIGAERQSSANCAFVFNGQTTFSRTNSGGGGDSADCSFSGNTFTWYSTSSSWGSAAQMNSANVEYLYFAIG